ncbi:methyltransferase domain-containing protein [Bradyrhizobium sp. RT9a]|uniref:class I SAM-dependent methyltransferase n=1 Tax=Bradyrhizobium sp. RT9a TaxID=3156384 RepID=UPI003396677F
MVSPPYSHVVLSYLLKTIRAQFDAVRIVELGAGTGNLLRSFIDEDIHGVAVEPNKEMRAVARSLAPDDTRFEWIEGTAEKANLSPRSANWVLLGKRVSVRSTSSNVQGDQPNSCMEDVTAQQAWNILDSLLRTCPGRDGYND